MKRGNYDRTQEHKTQMALTCRASANNKQIQEKQLRHRTRQGVEERYCKYCRDWFPVEGTHFNARKCKSVQGLIRTTYDCRIERKPYMAYYSARSRCAHNSYYAHCKVLVSVEQWVQWWREQQSRLVLKDPVVDRIDSNGHYELKNMQLIERADNSRKAYFKERDALLARIAELEDQVKRLTHNH